MSVFKSLLKGIGNLLAFIYPYKLNNLISNTIFNFVYTGWVQSNFKQFGPDGFITRPIYLHGANYIKIGNGFRTEKGLRLEAHGKYHQTDFNPEIIIGDRVSINFDCHIAAVNKIVIGNDVLIASKVLITDHYHGLIHADAIKVPTALRTLNSKGPVIINDNVWIGEGVCIMPNVTIGENCVIGANSVVTKSFPPNCIIGGIPAKIIQDYN